jgi:hypothetical protein
MTENANIGCTPVCVERLVASAPNTNCSQPPNDIEQGKLP